MMVYHNIHFFCLYLVFCITALHATAFEFPEPVRENIEWCRIWLPNANEEALPRVLFIGDSITVGYYADTESALKDDAYCGYYTTSRSVCDPVFFDELILVLKQYDYTIIHFNNGLHGWGYTEEQYGEGLKHFLDVLKEYAPNTKLIWAHSTSHNLEDQLDELAELNQRIFDRNQIAQSMMDEMEIPINDLFSLGFGKTEWYSQDKVHFSQEGKEQQAHQVAETVKKFLN